MITWEENKARGVWESEEHAKKNMYWFLQGHVIESHHVVGPNGIENHIDWMVLSVDCDCVRSAYIYVGKIIPTSNEQEDRELLSLVSSFKTPKYFPLPPFEGMENWSIVDLETPFYIERVNAPFSTAIHSLTVDGWHILNAVLQDRYTRALNITEAERLRTRLCQKTRIFLF